MNSNEIIQQLLVALIPGIIIAVLTAIVTVRLSLRQFYSQKWWERKADTYSTIIESLYHIKNLIDRLLEEEEEGVTLSAEKKKELEDHSKLSHREINKVTVIGAFMVSKNAALCLENLRKELQSASEHEESWYEYLNAERNAINTCLTKMREIAKKDLEV